MSEPEAIKPVLDYEWFEVPDSYMPPFQRALHIRMGVGTGGEGIAWVAVDPEIHYGNRWAHGGLVGALADVASGIAIARKVGDGYRTIDGTIELKVNFLRKVVDGDLTATARLLHTGRRIAFTEVDLTNKGTLTAKALATFMLRLPDPQPDEAGAAGQS
jgi:uncharacterized protein (TIGR00369 family)